MLTGHKKDKKQSRKETLENAHNLFQEKEMIVGASENGFFPLPKNHNL